ncbi:MAG: sarcosine oxidase subunit gamma [Alphaproteobacteria bacterium]|jgi:sarcosine oxidase subunit gamma|nr:sarcosine oxidase subunit gamma [Alphaproteobacteria bacterium]
MAQAHPDISAREAQAGQLPDQMPHPDGGTEGVVITDLSACGKVNLRCAPNASSQLIKFLGAALPDTPNMVIKSGQRRVIWLGPDEYLVLVKAGEEDSLSSVISGALASQHHAATIVTDALACLQLDGPAARDLLAKGCALDLHDTKFTPRMCAQTLLASASITLLCEADTSFRIICRTSFLDYVIAWLKDAACEYGYHVTPKSGG